MFDQLEASLRAQENLLLHVGSNLEKMADANFDNFKAVSAQLANASEARNQEFNVLKMEIKDARQQAFYGNNKAGEAKDQAYSAKLDTISIGEEVATLKTMVRWLVLITVTMAIATISLTGALYQKVNYGTVQNAGQCPQGAGIENPGLPVQLPENAGVVR